MWNQLLEFILNKLKILFFAFLLFISFSMIVFSETGSRENMKNFGSGASGAFQHLFGGFGESIVGGFRSLKSNKVLLEQNTELEKLLLEERQKTALYDQLVLENQELRHVINFSRRLEYSNIPGIIISGSPSNTNNIITINLGRGHNIKKDMPVVGYDDSGIFLIGKIDTVNIVSSTVIPIFSEKFGTGGIVENTYHRGLVEGLGSFNNFLTLKYIGAEKNLENQPIAIGALITTSMDSQLFPEGIPIGYVEKIEKRAWENSSIIFLRPYADFSKLKYIYVLSGDIR